MLAGAFAGIAVRPPLPARILLLFVGCQSSHRSRSTLSCTLLICSRYLHVNSATVTTSRSQRLDSFTDYKSFSWRNLHKPYQCCLYNHENRGSYFAVAWNLECHSGRWYVIIIPSLRRGLIGGIGPAHAVYFATYEAVKQAMGGNKGTEHHPLAAGNFRWC